MPPFGNRTLTRKPTINSTCLIKNSTRKIFNQNFYAQPENQNATIYQRDIAFEEHKRNNPELYTSITLQQAYDDLLLNQANNSSIITTDETAPFEN